MRRSSLVYQKLEAISWTRGIGPTWKADWQSTTLYKHRRQSWQNGASAGLRATTSFITFLPWQGARGCDNRLAAWRMVTPTFLEAPLRTKLM